MKKLLPILVLVIVAFACVACGGSAAEETTPPAQETEAEPPAQEEESEQPAAAEEGGNCNAETGEPGPGEGIFVERNGKLVCESQEGANEPVPQPTDEPEEQATTAFMKVATDGEIAEMSCEEVLVLLPAVQLSAGWRGERASPVGAA